MSHFGICAGHCTTDRREYTLSLGPIKGAGFRKKIASYSEYLNFNTKVMEIFDNYYARISIRGMCTVKKYKDDISVFWRPPI